VARGFFKGHGQGWRIFGSLKAVESWKNPSKDESWPANMGIELMDLMILMVHEGEFMVHQSSSVIVGSDNSQLEIGASHQWSWAMVGVQLQSGPPIGPRWPSW
jgi:hypothetical protein